MCLGVSTFAHADKHAFNDAESAVKYCQSALSIMRDNFAAMAAMVKGEEQYDAAVFTTALAIARLTHIPWDGFAVEGAMLVTIPMHYRLFGTIGKILSRAQINSSQMIASLTQLLRLMDEIKPHLWLRRKLCCHDQ